MHLSWNICSGANPQRPFVTKEKRKRGRRRRSEEGGEEVRKVERKRTGAETAVLQQEWRGAHSAFYILMLRLIWCESPSECHDSSVRSEHTGTHNKEWCIHSILRFNCAKCLLQELSLSSDFKWQYKPTYSECTSWLCSEINYLCNLGPFPSVVFVSLVPWFLCTLNESVWMHCECTAVHKKGT